jgi:hypothetical protein
MLNDTKLKILQKGFQVNRGKRVEVHAFISATSTEMSVSKPLKTCREVSKSSIKFIFACRQMHKNCHYRFQSDALLHIEIDHIRTSHLGDSGMKNRPGINNVQGKVPKRMDVGDSHQKELLEIN